MIQNTLDVNGKHIDVPFSREKLAELYTILQKYDTDLISIVKTVQQVSTMDELQAIINEELNSFHESEGFCKNEDDTKFADFFGSLDYDVVCKSTILDIKDMMESQGLL